MTTPRIEFAKAVDSRTLLVGFDNGESRTYDVAPLMRKEMFRPLNNPALFRAVQVEQGGYAVSWNSDIDISEYELWKNGRPASASLHA